MNLDFWHEKWNKNEIGFHLKDVHPLLKRYLTAQRLEDVKTVFVPLCGKTLDIQYLLDLGLTVVANELSESAVMQLFDSLGLNPDLDQWPGGQCYRANNITVWVGDFFELSKEQLGSIDLIYDRAALIALPTDMRAEYALHLSSITANAKQFLITLFYDQVLMSGPPFSISATEVSAHYENRYKIKVISDKEIIEHEAKFASRGLTSLVESAYFLI